MSPVFRHVGPFSLPGGVWRRWIPQNVNPRIGEAQARPPDNCSVSADKDAPVLPGTCVHCIDATDTLEAPPSSQGSRHTQK
jgi:hypothetical protein